MPGRAGAGAVGVAGRLVVRFGRAARARTVAFGMSGAQVSQTSSRLHTRRTTGSCRRIITTPPAQDVLVPGWAPHRWEPQWHQAWGLIVAAFACAAACAAAKVRSAVRSSERGGIRHAGVLQVTEAARPPWPVMRTVQARPGMRSVEDSL